MSDGRKERVAARVQRVGWEEGGRGRGRQTLYGGGPRAREGGKRVGVYIWDVQIGATSGQSRGPTRVGRFDKTFTNISCRTLPQLTSSQYDDPSRPDRASLSDASPPRSIPIHPSSLTHATAIGEMRVACHKTLPSRVSAVNATLSQHAVHVHGNSLPPLLLPAPQALALVAHTYAGLPLSRTRPGQPEPQGATAQLNRVPGIAQSKSRLSTPSFALRTPSLAPNQPAQSPATHAHERARNEQPVWPIQRHLSHPEDLAPQIHIHDSWCGCWACEARSSNTRDPAAKPTLTMRNAASFPSSSSTSSS
ncbi:uncharacterized protein LAESUDRAFT_762487 [Laetiporus sulphureus 93-53]|uniref:Uncharacterized protein n=1 Tax=Laetiporus sulphureus 93-53 TaxID=1314785 RepID=A0A165CHN5_9APHY|nr:uncharacterized protein LAESUDRAFT_762487 [Laetiporus sulphureus 93-53]KZT02833.1 hypothetical protein LAESUDRAFT_762487 [Laetiporus sulphureus 93-53]